MKVIEFLLLYWEYIWTKTETQISKVNFHLTCGYVNRLRGTNNLTQNSSLFILLFKDLLLTKNILQGYNLENTDIQLFGIRVHCVTFCKGIDVFYREILIK